MAKRSVETCLKESFRNTRRVFPNRNSEGNLHGKSIEIVSRKAIPHGFRIKFEDGQSYDVTVRRTQPSSIKLPKGMKVVEVLRPKMKR